MHVLTSVACIAFFSFSVILIDCIKCFSRVAIENTNNNYIISASRPQIVLKQQHCRSISKTTVYQQTNFEPSSMRGNFFHLARFGDIPSSHGDIPVVSSQLYEIELKHILIGFFLFFYPMGAFKSCSKYHEMQVYSCTFSKIGFSLDAKTQSLLGFIDAVQLITNITSVFHYEPFNNFGSWLTFPRTNNIADIFQLVYLRISGNASKVCTAFR